MGIPRFFLILMAVLLAGGRMARGQGLHDVLVSLEERRQAAGLTTPVTWTATSSQQIPTDGEIATMGLESRISLVSQAAELFNSTAEAYLNINPADLTNNGVVGAIRPFMPGDFDAHGAIGPANHTAVIARLAADIRKLRVLPCYSGRFIVDSGGRARWYYGQYEYYEENEWYYSDSLDGELANAPDWMPQPPMGFDAPSSQGEQSIAGNMWHDEINCAAWHEDRDGVLLETDYTLAWKLASTYRPPSVELQPVAGSLKVLSRNAWTPYTGAITGWDREDGKWKMVGTTSPGGAELALDPMSVPETVPGTWVAGPVVPDPDWPDGTIAPYTFVPQGYANRAMYFQTGESGYLDKGFESLFSNPNQSLKLAQREYQAVFIPAFTDGLDAPAAASGMERVERSPHGTTSAGDVAIRAVDGIIAGIDIGAGLEDSTARAFVGVSPCFHWYAPYGTWREVFCHPSVPYFGTGWFGRWDMIPALRLAGPASCYHVVHETSRAQAARGLSIPDQEISSTDWQDAGWSSRSVYFAAWDMPRLRQVVSRDVVLDFTQIGASGRSTTINVYRTTPALLAAGFTSGVPVSTAGLELIKTITWEYPGTVGTNGLPSGPEEIKVTEVPADSALPTRVTGVKASAVLTGSTGAGESWTYTVGNGSGTPVSEEIWTFSVGPGDSAKANVAVKANGIVQGTWNGLYLWDTQAVSPRFPESFSGGGITRTWQVNGVWNGDTTVTIATSGAPTETYAFRTGSRVPVSWQCGDRRTEWGLDGNVLHAEHKLGGQTYAHDWTEWLDGGKTVKSYSSPDGQTSSKENTAVAWSSVTRHGPDGALPWGVASVAGSGGMLGTIARAFPEGGGITTTLTSGHGNGSVAMGTREVITRDANGYPQSSETFAIIGGSEIKTGGQTWSQPTTWGAPTKVTDTVTGRSSTWQYTAGGGALASATDMMGNSTAITGRDALDRITGYTWNGVAGTRTFSASVTGTGIADSLAIPGRALAASTQVDPLGRPVSGTTTAGGNTGAWDIGRTATAITMQEANTTMGISHNAVLRTGDGSLQSATGTTMPLGGTSGEATTVENGLLVANVKATGYVDKYRTTWTDAWGRPRKAVEPGANGGTGETTWTYSEASDPMQRVVVVDAAGIRRIAEHDSTSGMTRQGIDINGDGQLGGNDRHVTVIPAISGGVIRTEVFGSGEPLPLETTTLDPATGIVIREGNGGESTLITTPDWANLSASTVSGDLWATSVQFNSLGQAVSGTFDGVGVTQTNFSKDLRKDGSPTQLTVSSSGENHGLSFDANGFVTGVTDPTAGYRQVAHGIANGSESITVDGATATRTLDGSNRSVTGTNVFANTVTTASGAGGLITTIAPAEGAATTITTNAAGVTTKHGYADGHAPEPTWEAGGLPSSIPLGRGGVITFQWTNDGARDFAGMTWPDFGGGGSGACAVTIGRDVAGRVTSIVDPIGTRALEWSHDRNIRETWADGREILRPLDAKGRSASTTVTDGTSMVVVPAYTAGETRELASLTTAGFTATYNRDGNRRITSVTRGNVVQGYVTQTYARGPGGRITSATSTVAGAPAFSYTQHDAQGRRTQVTTNKGTWTYGYRGGVNGDGQVVSAGNPGLGDFQYSFDGIGRRTAFTLPGQAPQAAAGNTLNQIHQATWPQSRNLRVKAHPDARVWLNGVERFSPPNWLDFDGEEGYALNSPGPDGGWLGWDVLAVREGGGDPGANPDRKSRKTGHFYFPPAQEAFTYDADGNRIGSARWTYAYDGLNRMTRAVNKDLATAPEAWDITFSYDAEGRRHAKTARQYADGTHLETLATTWTWDGWHPVVERTVDSHNRPVVERRMVWGPDLSGEVGGAGGAGGLLLIREQTWTLDGKPPVTVDLLPLHDGSGNIVGLAGADGTLLAEYWYGPFGELIEAKGPKAASNPYRWAGKYHDAETGLVYFGLRYYDPATGQWLSREPLGEGESLNLYAYCHNDPINRVDMLGAAEWEREQASKLAVMRDMVISDTMLWPAYDAARLSFANGLAWSGGPWARYTYLAYGEEQFIQWDSRMEAGADKIYSFVGPIVVTAGGSAQIAGGVLLMAIPEPTMATKVAGWYNVGAGADVLAGAWLTDDGKGFRQRGLEKMGLSSGWASGAILLTDIGVNAGAAVNWAGVSNTFKEARFPRISTVPGELYSGAPRLKFGFGLRTPLTPSAFARSQQGSGLYLGVDRFRDITIKKGTIIYGGAPGSSAFYTTGSAIRRAGDSATDIFQGLQVAPHPIHGYRPGMTAYEVMDDIPAAFGRTSANPQNGAGGLPQIVIPNWQSSLRPIHTEILSP